MSIGKKIRYALLGLTISVMIIVGIAVLVGLFNIKNGSKKENKAAISELYDKNVAEITDSSTELAQSLSSYYGQTINVDFERIRGELETISGDIETISKGGGTVSSTKLNRCEEYIVSQKAKISDEEIDETVKKYGSLTPMFDNVLANEPNISLAYIVFENGVVISSSDTFYPEVEKTDMRERDWYKNTVKGDKSIHWSELYTGKTDNRQYITCSIKVYDKKKKVIGVAAFDLRVSEISEKTLMSKEASFIAAFIIDRKGEVLLSSLGIDETKKEKYFDSFVKSLDLKKATKGTYDEDQCIIGYSQIDSTGWILVTVLDYDKMMQPVKSVAESVSATGDRLEKIINSNIAGLLTILMIIALVVVLIVLNVSAQLTKMLTKSIDVLVDGATIIGQGNLDHEIILDTNDEIGLLAKTFNNMTVKLKEYIEKVTKDASEKQRLASELDVARNIQLGMLPDELEGEGYDIKGLMVPAKEVGGDFYDYFEISGNRVCFIVADVSGKGVGAALFMTISKTIIKTAATGNTTIEELLCVANNLLCEQNPAELFVTVFVGFMDKSTGDIWYSCAAHNPPVLVHQDGTSEFIPVKHKLPLAAMEGMKYPIMTTKIEKGEALILYTDGVTEATNAELELYGDDRLLASAAKCSNMDVKDIVKKIKADVDEFVGDAPQFDDITVEAIKR